MKKKIKKTIIWLLGSILFALLAWAFTNHPTEIINNGGKIIKNNLICPHQFDDKTVTIIYVQTNSNCDCSKRTIDSCKIKIEVIEEGEEIVKDSGYILKNIRMNDIEIKKPSLINKIFK